MSDQITIRKAIITDLPTLLQFEQGIVGAERPFDITLREGVIHYYDLEQMITAPHVCLIVAEINGEIIGSGYARIEAAKPYLKHPQYAYLGFMYVVEAWRGKGVNKKIIDELKVWAVVQGMTEMRLEVYNDNGPALNAYEKVGFARHMIEMRIGL